MSTSFSCPRCQQHYAYNSRLAGKQAQCKKCGTAFRVPNLDGGANRPLAGQPAGPLRAPAAPQRSGLDDLLAEELPPLNAGEGLPAASAGVLGPPLAPRRRRMTRAQRKTWILAGCGVGGFLLLVLMMLATAVFTGGGPGETATSDSLDEIPPGVLSPVDVKVEQSPPPAGGATFEEVVDQTIAQMGELAGLLNSVRDEPSLATAKPKLIALVTRINETVKKGSELEAAGRPVSEAKKQEAERKRDELISSIVQSGPRIVAVPGGTELLQEIQKLGRVGPRPMEDFHALVRMSPEEHLKRLVKKYGPQSVVALVVEGLPKDRRAFLYQQIKAADTKIEPWSSWNQDRWITYAGPVADVNAFAAKLDLGVSRVNGEKRVVLVTMDPAKVPTTPAAEVTDPNDPN